MINLDKLAPHIIAEIAYNLGANSPDEVPEYHERIQQMTPLQAFGCWCTWQGFMGWGTTIWAAVEGIKNAEVPTPHP